MIDLAENFIGIILAGGQSRRFGSDKARSIVPVREIPLIVHLHQLLTEMGLPTQIVADKKDKYKDLGLSNITDLIPDQGPLGGLHTALTTWADKPALIITCDMPLLSKEGLLELLDTAEQTRKTCYYRHDGKQHPFPGVYQQNILPLVQEKLSHNELSILSLLKAAPETHIIKDIKSSMNFLNMNHKLDYEQLLQNSL